MYRIGMRKFGSSSQTLIYDDQSQLDELTVINPKLTLEVNLAGSLELTIPPMHIAYNEITRLTTELTVYRTETTEEYGVITSEIWRGRVIMEDTDFQNNRIITCEGEMAYLNDTIQPAYEYEDWTLYNFINRVVINHNSKFTDRDLQFHLIDTHIPDVSLPYRATNYETTYSILNAVLEDYGGMFAVYHSPVNGVDTRCLEYYTDYHEYTETREVRFGENLLDISKKFDLTEFATVIVPLGARLEESEFDLLDQYLDVSEVNDGSIYIVNEQTCALYGRKEMVVRFEDITTPQNLYNKGLDYLNNIQYDGVEIEVSMLDLGIIDINQRCVNLLDRVHVVSGPHGLNTYYPVTKLDIPLNSPKDMVVTLNGYIAGTKYKSSKSKKKASDRIASTSAQLKRVENRDGLMNI